MKRATLKKIDFLVDKNFRKEIPADIDQLQVASSEEIFKKAVGLFLKKWKGKKRNDFLEYFKNE